MRKLEKQSHRIKSQKKQRNTTCLTKKNDWRSLCELLQHGYPLLDACSLLEMNTAQIKQEVERGRDIFVILVPEKETNFSTHLKFFLTMMSFPHAIESALSLSDFEQGIQRKLLKKSAYPILIFVIAYVMLWFFTTAIIPQMMMSFENDDSFQSLSFLISIIQGVCTLMAVVLLILVVIALYLHLHSDMRVVLLLRVKRSALLKDYESYLFCGYLLQMELHGISTKSCMQFFTKLKKRSVLQEMTKTMRIQLEQGISLQDVFAHSDQLSKSFQLSFKIGSAANTLIKTLEGFMLQQEALWDRKIKKTAVIIQCISYSFVALVVVIVYQIMLVPLQMLEQM